MYVKGGAVERERIMKQQAMQAVGVQVHVEFIDTAYIAPGFRTNY